MKNIRISEIDTNIEASGLDLIPDASSLVLVFYTDKDNNINAKNYTLGKLSNDILTNIYNSTKLFELTINNINNLTTISEVSNTYETLSSLYVNNISNDEYIILNGYKSYNNKYLTINSFLKQKFNNTLDINDLLNLFNYYYNIYYNDEINNLIGCNNKYIEYIDTVNTNIQTFFTNPEYLDILNKIKYDLYIDFLNDDVFLHDDLNINIEDINNKYTLSNDIINYNIIPYLNDNFSLYDAFNNLIRLYPFILSLQSSINNFNNTTDLNILTVDKCMINNSIIQISQLFKTEKTYSSTLYKINNDDNITDGFIQMYIEKPFIEIKINNIVMTQFDIMPIGISNLALNIKNKQEQTILEYNTSYKQINNTAYVFSYFDKNNLIIFIQDEKLYDIANSIDIQCNIRYVE